MRSVYCEFTKMGKNVKMASRRGGTVGMELVDGPATRQIHYLTKEEVERLFGVIESKRDRLLFDLTYRHGLRRVEAAALQHSNLSADRIWINRAKGGVSGEYPIHPTTRRHLWAYLTERSQEESPFLFGSRQSGERPMSPSMIYHLFRRYAAAAGLPPERRHCHVLRHSIAVHLMTAGWDVADVQDWLGHRDIKSTMVYARIVNKRREARYREALISEEIADNAS